MSHVETRLLDAVIKKLQAQKNTRALGDAIGADVSARRLGKMLKERREEKHMTQAAAGQQGRREPSLHRQTRAATRKSHGGLLTKLAKPSACR
jgi:hypothetical protein